jgi:hypothetical protein
MVAPMTFLSGMCGVDGLTRPNKLSLAGLLAAVELLRRSKKRWHNCRNGATAKNQQSNKPLRQTDTWENERVDGIGLVRPKSVRLVAHVMWKRLVAHGSRVAGRISHYLFQEGFSLRPHHPSSVIVWI